MKKLSIVLMIFIMLQVSGLAAIKNNYENDFNSLQEIKRKLEKTSGDIVRLSKEINSLESKLGQSYKKYLQAANERKRIEKIINENKESLDKNEIALKEKLMDSEKMLKKLLVSQIDSSQGPSELLASKILIDSLKDKISRINVEVMNIEEMKKEMTALNQRHQEYQIIETNLQSLLLSLEEEKRLIDEKYQDELKNKLYLGSRYNKIREDVISEKKKKSFPELTISNKLLLPIKSENIRYEEGGGKVFIGYSSRVPIIAPGEGKVAYSGDLTTYGKLVMIDHGGGLHSVILGNFKAQVTKGDTIDRGQLIGITNESTLKNSELLFEIRKGSKLQKTVSYIDK